MIELTLESTYLLRPFRDLAFSLLRLLERRRHLTNSSFPESELITQIWEVVYHRDARLG